MNFSARHTSTSFPQPEFIIKGYHFLFSSYPNKQIFLYFLSFHESFFLFISFFCKKHERLDNPAHIRVPNTSRCLNSRFPRNSHHTEARLLFNPLNLSIADDQPRCTRGTKSRNHQAIFGRESLLQFPTHPLKLSLGQTTTKHRILQTFSISF